MYTYTLKASKKKLPLEEQTIIKAGISHEFTLKKVLDHKAELETMHRDGKAKHDYKDAVTKAYIKNGEHAFLREMQMNKAVVRDLARFFADMEEVIVLEESLTEIEKELKEYDKEIKEIKKQIGHEA